MSLCRRFIHFIRSVKIAMLENISIYIAKAFVALRNSRCSAKRERDCVGERMRVHRLSACRLHSVIGKNWTRLLVKHTKMHLAECLCGVVFVGCVFAGDRINYEICPSVSSVPHQNQVLSDIIDALNSPLSHSITLVLSSNFACFSVCISFAMCLGSLSPKNHWAHNNIVFHIMQNRLHKKSVKSLMAIFIWERELNINACALRRIECNVCDKKHLKIERHRAIRMRSLCARREKK